MEQDSTRAEAAVGSLATIVEAGGPIEFAEVLGMGTDIADALAERHQGQGAHGAVHSRAVLRSGDGTWILATPAQAAGNEPARAPELANGDSDPTEPGDVFALGAVLVFALT